MCSVLLRYYSVVPLSVFASSTAVRQFFVSVVCLSGSYHIFQFRFREMVDDQKPPQGGTGDKATAVAPNAGVPATVPNENADSDGPAEPAVESSLTVLQTISKVALSLVSTAVVYAFGYWRIAAASTWILLPLMAYLSVVRDRWREVRQLKRRRRQLAAIADEKHLVTANVSELPSWVFFPDIHRAEWLNQVKPTNP